MTQDIRYRLAVDGAQETAAGFDSVAAAMARQSAEKAKLASQDAAGQAFLGSLREQAALYNKTADDALRYKAAQLGVAQAAGPLILQLQNQRAAQEAAAKAARAEAEALRESAAAKKASENAQASFLRGLREQAELYGKSQADVLRFRAAQLGIGQGAEQFISQIEKQSQATTRFGVSIGQTNAALRQLPAQFTDIATSLAGGQSPLLVLLQQGGQIKDSFGSLGGAVQGVLSVFTPLRLAVGGAVGVLGLLASAALAGQKESAALARALAITGNAAGLTEARFSALARTVADRTNTAIGDVRDTLQQLAASGKLSGAALEQTATAVQRLSVATGEDASKIASQFLGLTDGIAKGALQLNKTYNFLTAVQFEYIKSLEDQGRTQEATAETMRLLSERIGDQTKNLGLVEGAWKSTKTAVSDFWDFVKGIGRDETLEDALKKQETRVRSLRAAASGQGFSNITQAISGVFGDGNKSALAEAEALVAKLRESAQVSAQVADQQAASAERNKAAITVTEQITAGLSRQAKFQKEIADAVALLDKAGASASQRAQLLNSISQRFDSGVAAQEVANAEKIAQDRIQQEVEKTNLLRSLGYLNERKFIEENTRLALASLDQQRAAAGAQLAIVSRRQDSEREQAAARGEIAALEERRRARAAQGVFELAKLNYAQARSIDEVTRALREQGQLEADAAFVADSKAREQGRLAVDAYAKSIDEQNDFLALEVSLVGQSAQARARAIEFYKIELDLKRQIRAVDENTGFDEAQREEERARLRAAAAKAAGAVPARAALEEFRKVEDQITQSVTDALINGGKNFADYLRNLFKTLVLRPLLEPVVRTVAGAIAGAGSSTAFAGTGTGSALSLGGTLQKLSSLPELISGSVAKGFNTFATSSIGQQFGLSSVVENGAGQGAVVANAGATTTGQVLGAAASYLAAYTVGSTIGKLISNGYSLNGGSGNSTINAGAAIGAVVNGPIGGAIGAAIGGAVNRLFGRKLVDVGIEGTLGVAQGFTGDAVQQFKGGLFRSDKTVREALDPELQALLSGTVAGIKDATAGYAAALGLPTEGIKAFTQEIKLSFKDLSQEQIQQLVGDTLAGFGKALVEPLKVELGPFIRAGEDASQTLARLADSLGGVNPVLRELGLRLFDVGLAGADAAQQLIDGFGGASGFASSASSFYEKYFTEAERAARGTEIITEQLGKLGLALPDSRESFRRLVEAQDLTTAAGRQAFTALLGVADAFDQIQTVAESAGGALDGFSDQLRSAIDSALPKFLNPAQQEARTYEAIVAQLQAAGVQATIATLRDASKSQIFDFAAAFVAAGSNSDAAKVAVVGAASALADLKDAASQLRDEVAGKLQGAIESALPKFLSPAQQQERQLQQLVAKLQAAGVQATVATLRSASKDQIFDFAQAFVLAGANSDEAKLAVVEAAGALADLKDASSSLTDSLTNDIRQFLGTAKIGDLSPLNPKDQFDAARQLFQATVARADAGDAAARNNLVANGRTFIEEAQQFFGGTAGAANVFREVEAALQRFLPENATSTGTTPLDVAIASQASLGAVETSIAEANSVAAASGEKQVAALLEVVANQQAQITQAAAVFTATIAELQRISGGIFRIIGDAGDASLQGGPA